MNLPIRDQNLIFHWLIWRKNFTINSKTLWWLAVKGS
ncbi:Uncharacterised protein [Burkholderia pseudomallei]|nr:Uncharacterised protein [Burkholderia pseudomallei]